MRLEMPSRWRERGRADHQIGADRASLAQIARIAADGALAKA
ncbi:MAG: hypothetical protein M5U07_00985 [Xanthobacteraceae bacterium]|nr:hypothetical protein [Xanthobacteraceae bacterium]